MHSVTSSTHNSSRRLPWALTAALLWLAGGALARAADTPELAPIFNGRDLAGWRAPATDPFWKVVDGVLVGENDAALAGSMLRTEKSYHDFVLDLEARWSAGADTGIFLREPSLQVQIGVSGSLKMDMTCSFYTGAAERYPAAGRAQIPAGLLLADGWNRIRLEAKGDTFTVWLNGHQVVRYVDARFPGAAPIGLQIHPKVRMKTEFRNIRARALD